MPTSVGRLLMAKYRRAPMHAENAMAFEANPFTKLTSSSDHSASRHPSPTPMTSQAAKANGIGTMAPRIACVNSTMPGMMA